MNTQSRSYAAYGSTSQNEPFDLDRRIAIDDRKKTIYQIVSDNNFFYFKALILGVENKRFDNKTTLKRLS